MSEEYRNDYLWDRSGDPPPQVAELEDALEALRWSGRLPELPRASSGHSWDEKRSWIMTAATVVVLGIGVAFLFPGIRPQHPVSSWKLSLPGQKSSSVRAGQVIETGLSRASMESDLIGKVNIDPDSRLRLLATQKDQHRLALDYGTIHAFIWASPTKFVVGTPAANAIDLGCQYTLSVASDGRGFLTVQLGWVAFQWNKIESFIPEGAACTTRVGHGPDTPYFLDAPQSLTKSLTDFDHTGNEQAVRSVLAAARPRDALTLWHLLERTEGGERAQVFERFAQLVNLPSGVTREGILRGDHAMMNAAWGALKLGNTSWWHEWKRAW